MRRIDAMVNAWSLLYSEMNGTMDEDYPIIKKQEDEEEVSDDMVSADFPTGNFYAADTVPFSDYDGYGMDQISFGTGSGVDTIDTLDFGDYIGTASTASYVYGYDLDDPSSVYIENDGTMGPLASKPKPNLKYQSQKYGEDKGIADLKDYVSSTYQGHYTNDNSDVQTLDLIHSVGDAESFCRSNALKYLSRYDKKGQAKRDILKAMHYCLLLYYFSGQTNETPTRGYETF